MFNYYTINDTEQIRFYQLPKELVKNEQFKTLSDSAKILYALLRDRVSLSIKNNWIDKFGRVYIIFTLAEIMEDLGCADQKATKLMKELQKIGLVESIRRGLGKPNIIYVKNFATDINKDHKTTIISLNRENHESENVKITNQEILKSRISISENHDQSIRNPTETNLNDTESKSKSTSDCTQKKVIHNLKFGNAPEFLSDLDSDSDSDFLKHNTLNTTNERELPFSHPDTSMEIENSLSKSLQFDYNTFRLKLQHNIDYFFYKEHRNDDIQLIDELLNCMLDVICTGGDYVKIGGELKSRAMVISHYLSLNSSDIDHVIDRYKEQSHKITHLHNYLKTMLYTVKQEASHFYTNAVRVDDMI